MQLTQLVLTHFRNFSSYEIQPASKFNLIIGGNGQGKTSLLEAIYFLGMGRSFRNHSHQPIIKYQQSFCRVVGEFVDLSGAPLVVGIEKQQAASKSQLRVTGNEAKSIAELAKLIPIQLVHHETFHLLDAGPQYRREFLDWGVFYAEPLYFAAWQSFQRALKQRNALLKAADESQLDFWEQQLTQQGLMVDQYRQRYLTLLLPVLTEVLRSLSLSEGLGIQYHAGWDQQRDYSQLLKRSRSRDIILGYTQYGPHRADLRIKVNQYDADHVFSRGQQKMFSFAMRVAQALLLNRLTQQRCLFLVDDLTAELDSQHISVACVLLSQLPGQIFISAVQPQLFEKNLAQFELGMFHVEHSNA